MTRADTDRLRDLAARRMQAVLDADEAQRVLDEEPGPPDRRTASGR